METPATKKNTLTGTVVSNKMAKTVVVSVKRFVKHPKYGKFVSSAKRYKAHYEGETLHEGSKVEIVACRPMSKDKRHMVSKVVIREASEAVKLAENE